MATYSRTIRRGLPRVSGGEPWPVVTGDVAGAVAEPAGAVVTEPAGAGAGAAAGAGGASAADLDAASAGASGAVPAASGAVAAPEGAVPAAGTFAVASSGAGVTLRRGLPRVAGGEPWPPAGAVAGASDPRVAGEVPVAGVATEVPQTVAATEVPAAVAAAEVPVIEAAHEAVVGGTALRRGLPRVVGGEPWPPAGAVARVVTPTTSAELPAADASAQPAAAPASGGVVPVAQGAVPATPAKDYSTPLPFRKTVTAGQYANVPVVVKEKKRIGRFTKAQWAGITVLAGGGLLFLAAMAVITTRFIVSMPGVQDFMATYPGHILPPEGTEEGFPAWARWQHYLNAFFMLLIIRTGWTVRNDRRPGAFWTPKWSKDGKGKISLTLWLHQALDLLWVINGVIFIVLLFVSGHWARLVPTDWGVFPNAVSAALQYVSLDWPVEHGWVYYNSLQQLMYFAVVFLAAPLAIITGLRMSHLWPKNAAGLNKLYPVELARAIHFPTMLFFVLFIVVHVFLVFSTGARVNLNHMFAGTDELNWTGFWIFFAGLVVMVGAWLAVRPLVIAPIAKLFGKVSTR